MRSIIGAFLSLASHVLVFVHTRSSCLAPLSLLRLTCCCRVALVTGSVSPDSVLGAHRAWRTFALVLFLVLLCTFRGLPCSWIVRDVLSGTYHGGFFVLGYVPPVFSLQFLHFVHLCI